jgi:hypothetical protein
VLAGDLAFAETRSLVTVVKPSGKDAVVAEATTRLKAEIENAGFRVRVVEAKAGDARAQVEEAIAPECASTTPCEASFATIAIVSTSKGAAADVWVADHVTKKTSVRRIDVASSATFASDLAVRSVELLRASLLEANAPAHRLELPPDVAQWIAPVEAPAPAPPIALPPPEEPQPSREPQPQPPRPQPQPLPRPQPQPHPRPHPHPGFFVGVAGGLLASAEVGPTFTPVIRAGYRLRAPLAFRLTIAPSTTATLSFDEGTIRVRQDLFALEAMTSFGLEAAPVRPLLALGAGVHHLHLQGDAHAPYSSEGHDVFSFAVTAGTGFVVRVSEPVTLVGEGDLVLLAPRQAIAVAGDDRARVGRPSYLGSLGLAFAF